MNRAAINYICIDCRICGGGLCSPIILSTKNIRRDITDMYEITTEAHFSAAHRLRNYNGPCENLHGHNWVVRASVRCEELDKIGLGIDFKILKNRLNAVLDEFDHRDINEAFDPIGLSPSSENIAKYIYDKLNVLLADDGVKAFRVEVQETPGNCAAYFE